MFWRRNRGPLMLVLCLFMFVSRTPPTQAQAQATGTDATKLFARDNLLAWCIVPFDAKKRGPEERVAMLKKLGFKHYAYDWRAEHLPSFERELELLEKHGIKLEAVWFPGQLNGDARTILGLLQKHKIKTQLWVTLGDPSGSNEQADKVAAAVRTLKPIAQEAARIDCRLGLYNHGGWFGEPENEIAIIKALALPNVGLVYNQHHGHSHLERFPDLLQKMLPHLYAINLNGMTKKGDQDGLKILPLATDDLDLDLLRTIRDSGYRGPLGILGHTQDDAEERLRDNLDGFDWLTTRLAGREPLRPKPRTPVPPAALRPPTASNAGHVPHMPTQNAVGMAPDLRPGAVLRSHDICLLDRSPAPRCLFIIVSAASTR